MYLFEIFKDGTSRVTT